MTDKSVPFSVLDLAPIPQGSSAKEAFTHSLDLAAAGRIARLSSLLAGGAP